jgi:hypothetical protein
MKGSRSGQERLPQSHQASVRNQKTFCNRATVPGIDARLRQLIPLHRGIPVLHSQRKRGLAFSRRPPAAVDVPKKGPATIKGPAYIDLVILRTAHQIIPLLWDTFCCWNP